MTEPSRATSVLIVDDDKLTDVLGREIRRMGFETSRVNSGSHAFRFFEENEVEVVLLDIGRGDDLQGPTDCGIPPYRGRV